MGIVVTRNQIAEIRKRLKQEGKKVVFTNGCFDILHRGHVEYLTKAKSMGDILIVGINSDNSVKRIKGADRPIVSEEDRSFLVSSLCMVDYVCIFEEDTPQKLIEMIVPDVLVKGADWRVNDIVGKDIVENSGGEVKTVELVPNRSTTDIIQKILKKGT